ncbi:protein translocase subunit SecF [Methyloligella sp. 2.7D]|uniref:protein translocase subunit SecF n=1 Tax=unclassified Methyloligella TaxID=2625955 RepID=UPI001FEF23F8|nr:protein translocase subunit SecF [Methyloligella sp. GL2]
MFRGFSFVPPNTKIDFIGMRGISFFVSALVMVLSLVAAQVYGLNFGIDFKGGTLIEISTKAPQADLATLRSTLNDLDLGEVQIQQFGEPNDVLIRIGEQDSEGAQQATVGKVKEALGDQVAEYRRIETVGATISTELIYMGTIAVVVAMGAILLYVWFRFEWQFAVAAIAALTHDVVSAIGLFCIFQLEFNLAALAAILTIIGYSLNDTVVVFDRIRENLRKYRKLPMADLIDLSINETLSRTTLTHFTTFLAVLALYLFGGKVIENFNIAMLWGIVVGAYSSIFVASPLLLVLGMRRDWGATATTKRAKSGSPVGV